MTKVVQDWTGRSCPECKGHGERTREDGEEGPCPDCGGTGDEHGDVQIPDLCYWDGSDFMGAMKLSLGPAFYNTWLPHSASFAQSYEEAFHSSPEELKGVMEYVQAQSLDAVKSVIKAPLGPNEMISFVRHDIPAIPPSTESPLTLPEPMYRFFEWVSGDRTPISMMHFGTGRLTVAFNEGENITIECSVPFPSA